MPDAKGLFPSCYIKIEEKQNMNFDEGYENESSKLYDAGFRLWYKGHLLQSATEDINEYRQLRPPSVKDEYRFIKKYWGAKWCLLIFVMRFFSFKNIFKELPAFIASLKVSSVSLYDSPLTYPDYNSFQSSLIKQNPLVSVIIPTLNRYDILTDSLHDLEKQSYKNFEVIMVDQSDDFDEQYYSSFNLQFKIIHQKEKLLWTARNKAIQHAAGSYLLFFDDDSRVEPDWVEQHLTCLDYFNAGISAGVSVAVAGGKVSPSYAYFRWADQFDSGNAMVKREVFEKINLFDEKFNNGRMGDGEFGIRAYLHGIRSISNCRAGRLHLKAEKGGLRETVSWDAFRPKKIFAPKPVPSVLYLIKKYFSVASQRHYVLQGMMLSNVGYKHKRSALMLIFSIFLFVIKIPFLYYQYLASSGVADKLKQSPDQIPSLNSKKN